MELKGILLPSFIFVLFMAMNLCGSSRLSHFDKIAVKSIKNKNGAVIDCMDVDDQPALEHPDLKNHKIQMRPSNFPKEAENINVEKSSITELWPTVGDHAMSCPDGTVPVIRTDDKRDVGCPERSSLQTFGTMSSKLSSSHTTSADDHTAGFAQYAFISVRRGEHYGAQATMNIWEPHVQRHDSSSSYIYLVAGSESKPNLNAIIVGWGVNPEEYGDDRSRLFVSWTRDSFESTGCKNLRCPGFVQVNKIVTLGAPFPILSNLSATQVEFTILIWKTEDAWWINYNSVPLGYWPLSLFSDLANHATGIGWGGNVFNSQSDRRRSTTTEMGSGHFPEEGFRRASYMRRLKVVDETLTLRGLSYPTTSVLQPNCYSITVGNANVWEDSIFYGGPVRNPKCP